MTKSYLKKSLKRSLFTLSLILSTTTLFSQSTVLINPATDGGFELGTTFPLNGWTVDNGSVTNKWYIGTVPSGMTNNSAYVSADAGVTNGYTNSSSSVVHFYRDVTFPAGETAIGLNFNWKGLGESGFYDALIVSLAPTTYTPTASGTSLSTNNLGAPTIELGRFWNSSTVQTATIQIPASIAGNCSANSTMRLIFTWKNDGSGGTAPSGAIDNISLISSVSSITNAGGNFTIDNTLPLGGTNFPNFSTAITALNAAYSCGPFDNPVVFDVTAGQTFNELPPAIFASGADLIPIIFQKSGIGANPVIVSSGTPLTTDASIHILGGDYITFDGIDINNSASTTMEFGYLLRNANSTNGATFNIIKNTNIQLNRNVPTILSAGILLTTSVSVGGGVAATSAPGANSQNQLLNVTINGAVNGISLQGTSGFPDIGNIIGTEGMVRNSLSNIGTTVSTFTAARGIHTSNQSGLTINNTDINGVTSNQAVAQGIFIAGNQGSSVINGNKIMAVSNQGSTSTTAVAYGIQAQNNTSGTHVVRLSNNMVSNIFSSFTGTATSSRYAIGIHTGVASAGASQSYEVYHNSVSIGQGLTPTYSNTCYEIQNVAAVYKVQNNIFANFTNAQVAGAFHYDWVTTSATNFGAAGSISNRNDLYIANDLGTSGFTARANTTNISTLANWTAAITAIPGTDLNSANVNPMFVNNNTNLHLNLGTTGTQLESGGAVLGIVVDIDGDTRPGPIGSVNGGATAPDMGADEFDGVPASPPTITLNSITPGTTAQCTSTARQVSVNVANVSGTITTVNLLYSVNGIAQTPIAMTNTSGTTWDATIPVPTPVNATISWSVTATNSVGLSSSLFGTSYSDEPLAFATATASASSPTVCFNSPTDLTATLFNAGTAQLGTGSSLTGATAQPTAFCNRWTSYRMQTVYTAAELNAAGLRAGPITAITYNITTLGDASTNANYIVKIGPTALTAFTDFVSTTGFTTVFPSATYTHAVGLNTVLFSTPYNWDGTSNIVIEVSHSGANLINNSQTYYTATAGNTVAWSTNGGATATLSTNRLNLGISGTIVSPITSVTWSDGAINVGTGNPLTVSPTSTTTYNASITASGCTFSSTPSVTVTVNPLPSAPTATNSTQCGTQVPTASVTSTTGATTPTFKWYDAATGGTLLQSSTSTTFTSNVTATTTMYVSEVDGVTLCESVRTPVTVTVSSADGIQASVANATICVGATADLSVVNTNPTPNQTYTYSWSGPAGSGAETPVPGATVNIATTASGTFTYTVTGVDGSCNAVSTVNVTVNPFTAILSPINITCNGYNNGSFSQTSETCGTGPFTYSVDGGAFGAIPTNLTPGAHSVIVKNSGGFTTSPISITITQPTTTISGPTGVNASVCEGSASAMVSATSNSSTPTVATPIVLSFNLSAQPTEVSGNSTFPSIATTPNIISTATLPAFPAGAVITGVTFSFPNLTAIPNSWQNDVGFGFTGAVSAGYGAGTGAAGAPGNFNYTRTLATGTVSLAGGTVNLNYYDLYNDLTSGPECTFPTGNGVATMTINYTVPTPAAITWWNASTGGTQIGTGSPFETVGTSVLPNTNTPGVYTVYAQGEFGGCNTPTRTAVTVTVNAETFSTLTATACDSYTLNSTTYTASGSYTQLMTNAAGCDSTITLNLTIKNSSSSTTTLTACNTYTWTNGATYTTSGTYSQTLMNAVGCDSVATLVLTINNSNTGTQNTTACDTYTWPATGLAYTTSGVYTTTLTNVAGCDSTVTLNLTINNSTSGMQSVTACNSYTWPANGVTYTVGGNYFTTLTNSVGCDSNVMLMLTINNSSSSAQTVTACDTYTWPTNSTTYTLSGTYTATFTNAVGCDSVVTLNLTINNSITNTSTITECDSYTWPVNGVTYTSGGTYTALFTSAAGCDSTEILNLTINNSTSGSETVTACDTFTWSATGITYSVGGMYMTTLTNAAGCDSNVMLMLTIYTSPTYTQTVTECDTYTWPLNNVTYTTGGTYTTIVPAGVGCDTIVTLQLTINNSSTSTTTVAQCDPYTWTDGNTYSTSGTYTQTLTNAIGCDSVATLVLTVHGYPTATATDNGDASMTASSGTTYEWIDCVSGNTLATSQTYTTAVNGSFAVVVTNAAGCADTSNCVDIDYIGIKEIEKDLFSVYPNPTLDQVTISMTVSSANVEVVDAQGKLLQVLSIENGGKIDLRSYETGVYYLRITSDNITEVQRIVKN